MSSFCLYSINFHEEAISSLESFLRKYPADKNIPYVLYLKGLCYFEQIDRVSLDQEPSVEAKKVFEECMKADIKAEVDLRNQKINYKIREHFLSKVPILLICGQKEVDGKSVSIRKLGSDKQETLPLNQTIKNISSKNKISFH